MSTFDPIADIRNVRFSPVVEKLGQVAQCRAMVDELAKAITRKVFPALEGEGFTRAKKRDLIRVENGIVQRLYFQVSGWGGREFCVTACANLIAGCEYVVLQPGFRLTHDASGADLWLPSRTAEQAERSVEIMLGSIRAQALPFFERVRTLAGFLAVLEGERWSSRHHLSFQKAITAALAGDPAASRRCLAEAIRLYEADGRAWCEEYIKKARELLSAIDEGLEVDLLSKWYETNKRAHGVK